MKTPFIPRIKPIPLAKYYTEANLTDLVGHGPSRFNKLKNLVDKDFLIKLRRGFYLPGRAYCEERISEFTISNLLYGPSYVSLESALSYYGLIPEGVYEITAINHYRTKRYQTPIGRFSYRKIPLYAFPAGLTTAKSTGNFIIASIEKALTDKLYLDGPVNLSVTYLTESLRIEESELTSLDWSKIVTLASHYNRAFNRAVLKLASTFQTNS